ncbi:MAG: translation repressor RelB [Deltaproteobacteria bacterium]|jgi:antitoxin component of RelBE/YafQ-DinJ toxin-antitoxin module|nr:translation repressor RelB [Deltaproteobacteria bacterium]
MQKIRLAARVDEEQSRRFQAMTSALGITPADALRTFIIRFGAEGGFPFETKANLSDIEAFASEDEATAFASRLSKRIIDEAR